MARQILRFCRNFARMKLINRRVWNARDPPTKEIKISAFECLERIRQVPSFAFKTLTRLLAARYLSGCCLEFSFKATYCILVPATFFPTWSFSSLLYGKEREREREREPRMRQRKSNEKMYLRSHESYLTRKVSAYLFVSKSVLRIK